MRSEHLNFQARVWIFEDSIEDIQVFVHELYPVARDKRPGEEWIRDSFRDCLSRDNIVEMVVGANAKGDGKNYQLLIKGTIFGSGPDYNGEYDEWIEIDEDESDHVELPKDWYGVSDL